MWAQEYVTVKIMLWGVACKHGKAELFHFALDSMQVLVACNQFAHILMPV